MPESARNLFMVNGKLTNTKVFDEFFAPKQTYIYEVFRVIGGVPLFIEDHLDRFYQTTALSGVDAGYDRNRLPDDIRSVIQANGPDEGNIKISIAPGKTGKQNLLIYYTPHVYPTPLQFDSGIAVKLLEAERNNPNAKVMDISLRAETDKIKNMDEVYEVLLVDRNGYITEGSRSNVFFISGDEVITPPIEAVLPGVTRKQIISLCASNQIRLSESPVHQSELKRLDALFISGTSRKVLPVNKAGELVFPVDNKLMKRIGGLFGLLVRTYIEDRRDL